MSKKHKHTTNLSDEHNYREIVTKSNLPWWIRLRLFFWCPIDEHNPNKDHLLLKIMSDPDKITRIYLRDYWIEFYFRNGEAVEFWNANHYYGWGNSLRIYKLNEKKKRYDYQKSVGGRPSRKIMKLFVLFCWQRGLL